MIAFLHIIAYHSLNTRYTLNEYTIFETKPITDFARVMILTNTKIIGVDFRKLLSNVVQGALAFLLTDATNSCHDLLGLYTCESQHFPAPRNKTGYCVPTSILMEEYNFGHSKGTYMTVLFKKL